MKALVDIYNGDPREKEHKFHFLFFYDGIKPNDNLDRLWHDTVRLFIKDAYNMDGFCDSLSLRLVFDTSYDFYTLNETEYKKLFDKEPYIEYFIEIGCHDDEVDFCARPNKKTSSSFTYVKKYVFKKQNKGNCIDDFLTRGLNPNLTTMKNLSDDIASRVSQRTDIIEYHQTPCYEEDFAQIRSIREIASRVVEICDKQLEAISDKYTKLN